MSRRAAWTLALLVAAAFPVAGQEHVAGRLVEASTGDPVADAMVALLDGRGLERDRRLSSASGRFRLSPAGPPPFTLVVEPIGFRRHELSLDLPGRGLVVRLTAEAIELPPVLVVGERACSISSQPPSKSVVAAWDLVRATLARTTLAGSSQGVGAEKTYDVTTYEGEMDPALNFRRFEADTLPELEGPPFAFVDSAALAETGWSEELEGRRVRYVAPSPGLLLTAWFQSNHCFALEAVTPDTLQLRFRSASELPGGGIEGAFVVSRLPARVARVEFRHLAAGPPAPEQGGEIVLAHAADGSWYVREWWMRTPVFKSRPTSVAGPLGRALGRWRHELVGYEVRGGIATRRPPGKLRRLVTAETAGSTVAPGLDGSASPRLASGPKKAYGRP